MKLNAIGLSLLCLTGLGTLTSISATASELMVHNAWIRAMPPTSRVVPVYLTLHNPGNEALVVKVIDSERGVIELHQTLMEGDTMRMAPLTQIEIPAHGVVKLAPGGMHGMMSDFAAGVPAKGEQVPLTLTLTNGETLSVTANVLMDDSAETSGEDHSMHH